MCFSTITTPDTYATRAGQLFDYSMHLPRSAPEGPTGATESGASTAETTCNGNAATILRILRATSATHLATLSSSKSMCDVSVPAIEGGMEPIRSTQSGRGMTVLRASSKTS